MNWLNLSTQVLDSPELVGSEPTDRATWLFLLRFCVGQENGGTIAECRKWSDRKWQQLVRITKDEAMRDCDLWSWDGDSMVVWAYPSDKEQEVVAKREFAKTNGKKGGRPKNNPDETNVGFPKEPTSVNSVKAEENRREGNRIEENSLSASASYADSMPTESATLMLDLEKRVQAMRPGWRSAMSYIEQQSIVTNARCLASITEDQWQTVEAYMAARLPEGSPGYQPRSRMKFIEGLPDVLGHAVDWQRKQRPRVIATPPPQPTTERKYIDRAELAQVFTTQKP